MIPNERIWSRHTDRVWRRPSRQCRRRSQRSLWPGAGARWRCSPWCRTPSRRCRCATPRPRTQAAAATHVGAPSWGSLNGADQLWQLATCALKAAGHDGQLASCALTAADPDEQLACRSAAVRLARPGPATRRRCTLCACIAAALSSRKHVSCIHTGPAGSAGSAARGGGAGAHRQRPLQCGCARPRSRVRCSLSHASSLSALQLPLMSLSCMTFRRGCWAAPPDPELTTFVRIQSSRLLTCLRPNHRSTVVLPTSSASVIAGSSLLPCVFDTCDFTLAGPDAAALCIKHRVCFTCRPLREVTRASMFTSADVLRCRRPDIPPSLTVRRGHWSIALWEA